jgi:hypothetical protein
MQNGTKKSQNDAQMMQKTTKKSQHATQWLPNGAKKCKFGARAIQQDHLTFLGTLQHWTSESWNNYFWTSKSWNNYLWTSTS